MIAFFCCSETILKKIFQIRFSEFTFSEARWVEYFFEIVKRFSLSKTFRFFSACKNFSVNAWKWSMFKYVRKVKKFRYFSDNWNKVLIVLIINDSFTIQLLKYDSEFCFFWAAFFLIFLIFFFSGTARSWKKWVRIRKNNVFYKWLKTWFKMLKMQSSSEKFLQLIN